MLRRWAAFFACLLVLWAGMFIVAPMAQRLSVVGSLARHIEESGINASALFYTGVDETAEAEMYLHNAGEYAPGRE